MPCDGAAGLTEVEQVERTKRRRKALERVEADLLAGRVKLVTLADGTRKFEGWPQGEREGFCDACAYRALSAEGSSALRLAQSRQQPDRMARRATS